MEIFLLNIILKWENRFYTKYFIQAENWDKKALAKDFHKTEMGLQKGITKAGN